MSEGVRPDISDFTLEEMGFSQIFDLKNGSLSEFFTSDEAVINYRRETFGDMLDNPELIRTLNDLLPILSDIMELRRLEADSGDPNDYLSSITEIELYISCIDTLDDGLNAVRDNLKGQAFRTRQGIILHNPKHCICRFTKSIFSIFCSKFRFYGSSITI